MKSKYIYFVPAITVVIAAVYFLFLFPGRSDDQFTAGEDVMKHVKPSGALQSLQFLSQIRAFPEQDIPQDKFFSAVEYSKTMPKYDELSDSPTQWTSIGPNNIGGRSLCLAFSPVDTATLYMGSASGGLWKSITGGLGANAWQYIETGYPSLAVSTIAIDSTSPNTMYIGTGENYGYQYSFNGLDVRVTRGMYGIGILKTTNGGVTWSKSLDWTYNSQRGVWKVLLNPKNRNTVYAATSEGVWKSINAGATWFQMLNYQMVMDMRINPVDTSVLYISVGNLTNNVPNANVGIYKSTNAGTSWVKLSGGLPATWTGKTTLELYRGNPDFVYASIANDLSYVGYYTSTNAGLNWTVRSTTVPIGNQGWYNNAHMVKANDPNQIIVGTIDLVKSTNGGTSFTTKSSWSAWNTGATPPGQPESSSPLFAHADHHSFESNPKDPNKIYCITDGGLYRSNDFGETYYSCNGGYVTSQFYAGFANSMQDSNFCLGGLQDNRAAFYQGTTAWYKTFSGDGMWAGINSQNHNICYMEYTNGAISRSTNGGINWSGITSGLSGNFAFVTPYIVCRSNPNVMYIAGNNIFRSTNGGTSWANTGALPYNALSMDASATGTDTVYVGVIPVSAGQPALIYRSVNGTAFANISGSQLPSRYPTDIHVNPNNAADVYVTMGGFSSGHVYRTINAGVTWNNISGNLPDVPHQTVCIDPQYPANIYVGNDLGVYASSNGGSSWFEFRTGMPYALVFDLAVVYPSRNIRAVTHGNGVYERDLMSNIVGITQVNGEVPKQFALGQNYPNPFNPETKIRFVIPEAGFVQLKIYDVAGRTIEMIVNKQLSPSIYDVTFDGTKYTSGLYFYQLTSDGKIVDTKKMCLVK
ncbi:MAG: T9SS type A sorting domain-containing protein [Ignavibacteria bacterium]|nr:T9SS type A sorting domain-containing protein [Ignavibacteria bacterium]